MTYSPPLPPPSPQRLSIAAAVSLAAGIVGCLVVTGIVAVVAGVIGLRQTRDPNVRGRGMAIAGIVLGIVFGLTGAGFGVMSYAAYRFGLKQVTTLTPLVVNAAVDNNHPAAAPYTTLSPEGLADLGKRVEGWGKITAVTTPGWTGRKIAGQPSQFVLTGTAVFDKAGEKRFEVTFEAKGNEVKVVDVTFR